MADSGTSVVKSPARVQTVTILGTATAPATGLYFLKEHLDLASVMVDDATTATKIVWKGALTRADADAGTFLPINWNGAAKETSLVAADQFHGEDPLHFAAYPYLQPTFDAANAGATVVTAVFRGFS